MGSLRGPKQKRKLVTSYWPFGPFSKAGLPMGNKKYPQKRVAICGPVCYNPSVHDGKRQEEQGILVNAPLASSKPPDLDAEEGENPLNPNPLFIHTIDIRDYADASTEHGNSNTSNGEPEVGEWQYLD